MNIHCPEVCLQHINWLASRVSGYTINGKWPSSAVRHHNTGRVKAAIFASFLIPLTSAAQSAMPDCQCRAPDGQMRDLGSVECVDIVGNKSLMICVMSTNTPYWKKIENSNGCPA